MDSKITHIERQRFLHVFCLLKLYEQNVLKHFVKLKKKEILMSF